MKIENPAHVWQLMFEGEWPTSVAFLGDRRKLAAGNRQGQIFVWHLPDEPPVPAEDDPEKKKSDKEPPPPDFPPVRRLDGHTNGITRLISLAGLPCFD